MALEIRTEAIKQLQIALRKQANMSSYGPDDTPLPILPSPEDTISEVDPSPPYLRCKHCKGRLLRGVASLICVFCGAETCKDLPPDPINFRNTVGFQWLLKSLALTGSEIVDQSTEANESGRGQTASKEEFRLSELLNVEIRWTSEFEKSGTGVLDKKSPTRPKSFLDLAGVNVDNFFSEGEKDAALGASEELFEPSTRTATTESSDFKRSENLSLFASDDEFDPKKPIAPAERNAFKVGENLSLFAFDPDKQKAIAESSAFQGSEDLSLFASEKSFESSKQITTTVSNTGNETLSLNVQPSETAVESTKTESADSISSWPPSFQFPASENLPQESKSHDPFVGSTVDLSAHMDTMFGSVEESTKLKSNHSTSTSNDWFSDDLLSISDSALAGGQPKLSESLATVNDDKTSNSVNNLHSTGVHWVEDTQWQSTKKEAPDNKTADEDVDTFGAWNDFTSSSNAQNRSTSKDAPDNKTADKDDDTFGAWNDFTSLSIAQNPSTSKDAPDNKTADKDDDSFGVWNDFTSSSNAQNPSTTKDAPDNKTADEDDDSFGAWNEFTSSSNPQNPSTSKDAPDNKTADEDDDSFGAWNDFTSSSNPQNPSSSSKQTVDQNSMTDLFGTTSNSQADDSFGGWNDFTSLSSAQNASSSSQQTVDQMKPADDTSVAILFSTANDSRDFDFGSFMQPDLSAGISGSSYGSTVMNITQPEASVFDRMADRGTQDVVKGEGDIFSAKAGSKSHDVEKIMSQMHDLSFMLESNLSIPPKRDLHSHSEDHT